jgi:hydrogenase maturation protease
MQQQDRSIIIGLGNPLLTDDAVGPEVARRVHGLLDSADFELCELAVGGVELMETIIGYKRAVIIDAILTENGKPGTCYLLDLAHCPPTMHASMSHEIGLLEGLELGRRLGLALPERLWVYAVTIVDPFTFGTKMTDRVERAIPRIAREIAAEIRTQFWASGK